MKTSKRKKSNVQVVVQRGIDLLDLLFGNRSWVNKINLNKFDMAGSKICVAGYVFGDWHDFERAMTILNVNDLEGKRFGFQEDSEDFSSLQEEWLRRLRKFKGLKVKRKK